MAADNDGRSWSLTSGYQSTFSTSVYAEKLTKPRTVYTPDGSTQGNVNDWHVILPGGEHRVYTDKVFTAKFK